jgi:hypothetical protein
LFCSELSWLANYYLPSAMLAAYRASTQIFAAAAATTMHNKHCSTTAPQQAAGQSREEEA